MILEWFGNPIYRTKLENYKDVYNIIIDDLNKLFYQDDGLVPPWISTGFTRSTFPRYEHMDPNGKLLFQNPKLKETMEHIQELLKEYWTMLNLNSNYDPNVEVMWAQRYETGIGDNHNHPNHLIGGGLYLLVEGEQTITFDHPSKSLYNKKLMPLFQQESLRETILLEPGDIIFWPGWMYHEIEAKTPQSWKKGDPTRITLPFMVNYKAKE